MTLHATDRLREASFKVAKQLSAMIAFHANPGSFAGDVQFEQQRLADALEDYGNAVADLAVAHMNDPR